MGKEVHPKIDLYVRHSVFSLIGSMYVSTHIQMYLNTDS